MAQILTNVGRIRPLVLGLPRGGVVVGTEVANSLSSHLDVFVVRKLGLPVNPEMAMGAIASGGVRLLNESLIDENNVTAEMLEEIVGRESLELARRERIYREGRPPLAIASRTVVLVDDGLATGFTMKAAVTALRKLRPAHIVAAVPVGASSTCNELARSVDLLICPLRPEPFGAVGLWYDHFAEVDDEAVTRALSDNEAHFDSSDSDLNRWSA